MSHAERALAFLEALDPDARRTASSAMADAARRSWTYLPGERTGVAFHELDRPAAVAARRLLAGGLGTAPYAAATSIIGLEDVLDGLEGGSGRRHAGDYWVAVFGTPGDGTWAWRVEGHHLSVNVTLVGDDVVAATPLFLGANPARLGNVEPLRGEEELAFALLHALDPSQREVAIVAAEAPDDLVDRDAPSIDEPPTEGVRVGNLGRDAADTARALVDLYLDRLPDSPRRALDDVRFAWAGATEPGGPHWYQLHGPGFYAELDNTQDGANHVHSVLRHPGHDFGDDVLADHYRHAH